MAALPWNQISSIDQICHKSPSYAQILISKLKVDMTCSFTTTGSYIFHDYWVTLQRVRLFSNVFTLSAVKKTWSEITLKVFQTWTGVKNTWSAMENILLPRAHVIYSTPIDWHWPEWRTLRHRLMCGDILLWKFYSTTP